MSEHLFCDFGVHDWHRKGDVEVEEVTVDI